MNGLEILLSGCALLSYVALPFTSASLTTRKESSKFYTAAVYEHKVKVSPVIPVSRDDAVKLMMRNLEIFESQTIEAASKVSEHQCITRHKISPIS